MRVVQNEMNRPVCSLMPLCAMLLVSFCIYLDRDMHWRSMHNHLKAQNTRLLINLGFSLSCLSVSRLLYAYQFRTFDEEDIFFVLNKIASEHSLYFWCFRFSVVRHPSMLSLHWTPNSTSYSATGSSSWKNSGPCNQLLGSCRPAGDEEAAGETDWGNLDNDCTSSHAHKCSYLVGEIGNVFKLVGGGTSQNDSEGAETAPSNLQASKDATIL